jgi:MoaA/NifB/PqqE/SkfB family radical SAM enzyme
MRFFDVPVRSFNMEITNRCTLGCPRCARTDNDWVKANLADISLEVLEHTFPLSRKKSFEGLRVNLCGTYGDCIYHRRFHEVLAYLKKAGIGVSLETNGSHRKMDWWRRTCEILTDDDMITFSVDGLADTNHIYRVNARWKDIEQAMRYCAKRVAVDWKFIVFRHNEHQLDEARLLAEDIGIRRLGFKKSGRFGEADPMTPLNNDYVGVVTRNRREIDKVLRRNAGAQDLDRNVKIAPKCRFGKDLSISAHGYFYPCSTAEPGGPSGWFHDNLEHFDLRRHSIEEIFASDKWRELEASWKRASTAPLACRQYCGVHKDYLKEYDETSRPDRPNKPQDLIAVAIGS